MAFVRHTNQLIPETSCVDLHSKLFQPEKSSCNRHSLLLSTAEFEPALPNLRFVPIGQRDDLGRDGYINPWDNLNRIDGTSQFCYPSIPCCGCPPGLPPFPHPPDWLQSFRSWCWNWCFRWTKQYPEEMTIVSKRSMQGISISRSST